MSGVGSSFRDLLREEIEVAWDAAVACELTGHHELAQWWRWRVLDLEAYLADAEPGDGVGSAVA